LPFESLEPLAGPGYIAGLELSFSQGQVSLELVTEETALLGLGQDSLKALHGFLPICLSTRSPADTGSGNQKGEVRVEVLALP